MKKNFIYLMLALALAACKKDPAPEPTPEPEPEPVIAKINVGSFNIRLDTSSDTGTKDWQARKANCAALIKEHKFDVFGMQEVLSNQQADLKALLPEYGFYFVGRDTGTAGEAVGVGYDKEKFEIEEWSRFWLSDTPDKPSGSLNWDGMSRHRVAAWVLLRHKESGKEFYFLATHLEVNNNGVSYAGVRAKSAALIIERMNAENSYNLPLFVVGDMNPAAANEEALETFRAAYSDAYGVATADGTREGPKATFQNFDTSRDLDKASSYPADYIFYKGDIKLNKFVALTDKYDNCYPSDHLPVMAEVEF